MADDDTIKVFTDGETLLADDINGNNDAIIARINNVKTSLGEKVEIALNKANNSLQKTNSTTQTVSNRTEFTGTVIVPSRTETGTAISLVGVDNGEYGGISLGCNTKINWGKLTMPSAGYKEFTFKFPFKGQENYVVHASVKNNGRVDYSPGVYRINGSKVRIYGKNNDVIFIIAIGS